MTPTDRFVIRQENDRRLFAILVVIAMIGIFALGAACFKIARDGYDHEQLVYWELRK